LIFHEIDTEKSHSQYIFLCLKHGKRWFYRASVDSKDSYSYWLLGKSLYEGLRFEDIKISARDAAAALKIDWYEWYEDVHDNASISNILAAALFTIAEGVHQAKHHLAVMFEYGLLPYDFWKGNTTVTNDNSTHQNTFSPNFIKANELYRSAALEGSIESLYNLGLMYTYGRGVPVNYSRAVDLFRRAASSQHSPSMRYLGFFATQGWGQSNEIPDFKEAIFWFSKCAQYAPPYVKELCEYDLNNIRQSMEEIETTYYSILQGLVEGH
jgi:Sel1 repeat.